ncbi:guanylate kinase [bacterium]|nr:guanylate kinase [bacterium]
MKMKKGKLFVISGSSGVGKGTLISLLLKNNSNIMLSISHTTRSPRQGEVDGVNYFFRTKEEFQKSIEENAFLEWAQYSDNFYGTKRKFVERKLNEGFDLILEIDTQGALKVKEQMPDAILIFILPPSLKDLENRLRGRKTETEEAIQKRLNFVESEMKNSSLYDYQIVNDDLQMALEKLKGIIKNA